MATPETSPAAGEPCSRAERDPHLDNFKFLLIALVVLGHLLELIAKANPIAKGMFLWIYSFHMPAFIFVAGYFSKRPPEGERMLKLLAGTVAPYAVFQLLYRMSDHLLQETPLLQLRPFEPKFHLWFLISLLLWRALVPYLLKLRYPLLLAILAGLLAGYAGDARFFLGGARTLVLLPFFVAGTLAGPEHLAPLRARWVRWGLAPLVLVAALALALHFAPTTDPKPFFFGERSYAALGDPSPWAAWTRVALYAWAALLGLAFLAITPTRRSMVTVWGQRTMYVYLLHAFLVQWCESEHLERTLARLLPSPTAQVVLVAVASLAVTVLLALRPTRWLTWPLVEPRPLWLRRWAVVALAALFLVATPASLRHFGAKAVRQAAVQSSPSTAVGRARIWGRTTPGPVAMGSGGLIVSLDGRHHQPRLLLGVTGGEYRAVLYRRGRKSGGAPVECEHPAGDSPAACSISVPRTTAARGYDLVVLEPLEGSGAGAGARRLEYLRPDEASRRRPATATRRAGESARVEPLDSTGL